MGLEAAQLASATTSLTALSDSVAGVGTFLNAQANVRTLNERGDREVARVFREGGSVIGAQQAAFSASGVTLEGTPQDVQNSTLTRIHEEAVRASRPFYEVAANIRGESLVNLVTSSLSALTAAASGLTAADAPLGAPGAPAGVSIAPGSALFKQTSALASSGAFRQVSGVGF